MSSSTYDPKLCTYENLARLEKTRSTAQMCDEVAKGICNGPHHYFNMFRLHYCFFSGSKFKYLLLATLITIITFLWINYVRRAYYVRPLIKLRKRLNLSSTISETVLIPLAYGIGPVIVGIQGATKDMEFSFALSSTLGTVLNLSGFIIGICSVVLKLSRKYDPGKIALNLLFIVIAMVLMLILGFKKSVDWVDGLIFLGAWLAYVKFMFLYSLASGKVFPRLLSVVDDGLDPEGEKDDSRKSSVIKLDEELAEKLNQEPSDHLDTVHEQVEEEDEDAAPQEIVEHDVAQKQNAPEPQVAKPAKVPKPKKKKQPKKTVVQVQKKTEVQKLSRAKKTMVPKKKTRVLPFVLPAIENAAYAEVEEYCVQVSRPIKEVKRLIPVESTVDANQVTEISLNLDLGLDAQPSVTQISLDLDQPAQTDIAESSSGSDSEGSSDESSDDSDDSSSVPGEETVVNTELQLDLEPAKEEPVVTELTLTNEPVLELNLNVEPAKPVGEEPVKKTKKVKKKVKKMKKKVKDPKTSKKAPKVTGEIEVGLNLTESQIIAEVAKKKRRVKRAKPLFDANGNKIVDGQAPTKPKKAPVFKKGISDKIRLMQMRFELTKDQNDPNSGLKSTTESGADNQNPEENETPGDGTAGTEGQEAGAENPDELEEEIQEGDEEQQEESGESEYTYETDTDEEQTEGTETAPTENQTTNADTENLNITLSSEELNAESGSETETETETEETVTDDSESEDAQKTTTEGVTLDLGLGGEPETPGTVVTLDLGIGEENPKPEESIGIDLQSQILGGDQSQTELNLEVNLDSDAKKDKPKKSKKDKKDKKKKSGKKKEKKSKKKSNIQEKTDQSLVTAEIQDGQTDLQLKVSAGEAQSPQQFREETVFEIDYEANPFFVAPKTFTEEEVEFQRKVRGKLFRAILQLIKSVQQKRSSPIQDSKSQETQSLVIQFAVGSSNIQEYSDAESLEELDGSEEFYDAEVEVEEKVEVVVTDNDADSVTDSNQSQESDSDSAVGENPLDTTAQQDSSKLDQLNAIDGIKANQSLVQPVKTVVKKGEVKRKIVKPEKKMPSSYQANKDYNYGIDSDEARDKATRVSDRNELGESFLEDDKDKYKYRESDQQDRKDIKKYMQENKSLKNPVVKCAEIDDILFKNLRSRPVGNMTQMEKILSFAYLPISFLTYLTILPTSNRQYNKLRYLCYPLVGGSFIAYVISKGNITVTAYLLCVVCAGAVATLGLFAVLKQNEAPTGRVKNLLLVLGVFSSLCWLWVLSDLLVSMIKTMHIVFNYHYVYMMIAIFAFLAWLPMSIGSLKVVRLLQHMPGYSGAVFNSLFIFGLTILIQTIMHGAKKVEMFPRTSGGTSFHVFFFVIVVIISCTATFFLLRSRGWKYTQFLGLVLALLYNVAIIYTIIQGVFSS